MGWKGSPQSPIFKSAQLLALERRRQLGGSFGTRLEAATIDRGVIFTRIQPIRLGVLKQNVEFVV